MNYQLLYDLQFYGFLTNCVDILKLKRLLRILLQMEMSTSIEQKKKVKK